MKTRLNPDTGIREWGPDEYQERKGWLPWIEKPQPVFNPITQYVVEGEPNVKVDRVVQTWDIIDKSAEQIATELAATQLQNKVDNFKASTAWTQIKAEQDLTNAEIQETINFLAKMVVRKLI